MGRICNSYYETIVAETQFQVNLTFSLLLNQIGLQLTLACMVELSHILIVFEMYLELIYPCSYHDPSSLKPENICDLEEVRKYKNHMVHCLLPAGKSVNIRGIPRYTVL